MILTHKGVARLWRAREMAAEHLAVNRNPAYGVTSVVHEQPTREAATKEALGKRQSFIVIDQPEEDIDKIGKSSKWDHHITLAMVVTILSVFALNFIGLFCGIAAIYFAYKGRVASRNEDYREKIENERSSFASVIMCVIMWILTWCIAGFAVHYHFCGVTGASCDTRTHV